MMKKLLNILIGTLFLMVNLGHAQTVLDNPEVQKYIEEQVARNNFTQTELVNWFKEAKFDPNIVKKITTPYEAKPWYQYRDFFITDKRIQQGRQFEKRYGKALMASEKTFGVPEAITTSIIGVETFYGQTLGKYPVLDALTTLAFTYPPREKFFRKELTEFLLLCKQHQWNPAKIQGSYAGAMGLGQFMPSSYRAYSVNFDQSGHADLFANPVDAIGSVANYLKKNGWQANQPIAISVKVGKKVAKSIDSYKNKRMTIAEWKKLSIQIPAKYPANMPARFLILSEENGNSYWLVFHNFEVIKRYNTSDNYVMVVFLLSQKL